MAAYAAVVSLKQTIERILESSFISLVSPSSEIIQLAYRELEPFPETLERLDSISPCKSRKKVNSLDGRIKDSVWRFEDLVESLLSDQILSQLESSGGETDVLLFSIDLQSLRLDVDSFIDTVKNMEKKYLYELDNLPELEEDESFVSSRYDFGGMKAKMVGFSDIFGNAKYYLTKERDFLFVYTLVGMPGSGKTSIAEKVFEDEEVLRWFEHRVWVTVGRKYELNEIALRIRAQLDPDINKTEEGDEKLHLKERLKGKRCLIVLDDVWDTQLLDYITTSLRNRYNGLIQILLTTNLYTVAKHIWSSIGSAQSMRPLNEKESTDLLRETVFGEEDFPPQLEKAATKIAKNCKGFPLMIVTVAHLLSKANKNNDPEYWNEVAENRNSVVMMDAHNQISKVLFPVYDCSPQSFKMFYLYLGAFPQDYDIPASKLMNMLTAEGFLHLQTLDQIIDGKMKMYGPMNSVVISKAKSKLKLVALILPGATCSTKKLPRTSFFASLKA